MLTKEKLKEFCQEQVYVGGDDRFIYWGPKPDILIKITVNFYDGPEELDVEMLDIDSVDGEALVYVVIPNNDSADDVPLDLSKIKIYKRIEV